MVVRSTYTVKVIDEEGIFGPGILGGLSSSIPSPRIVHSFKGHELYGGHPSEA